MSAENRLTAEQLAALSPGDAVTIECAPDLGRTRLTTGVVVRVAPLEVFVSVKSRGGGKFLERYSRRDGMRTSGSGRAELVNGEAVAATTESRREMQQIDRLYWAWHRRPGDVEALRTLHEAIEELLAEPKSSR